jgi:NAD(P)-dependent dehydrogenase (short-subunit alcohol dehydrogenase family)
MLLNELYLECKLLFKKKKDLFVNKKLLKKDLSNKIVIITGANSGLGFETSKQLLKQKATIILACRNKIKAEKSLKKLKRISGGNCDFIKLDLSSFESVRTFVKNFKDKYKKLHVLINNAGIAGVKYDLTKDGFEKHFGVNYLGHFYLTYLLDEVIRKTGNTRIINLTSVNHDIWRNPPKGNVLGKIIFDDLNYIKRKYSAYEAYGQSKLAIFLHTKQLAKIYENTNVKVYSVNPGWVRTNSARYQVPFGLYKIILLFMSASNTWVGIQSILLCALSDELQDQSGLYFSAINLKYKHSDGQIGGWPMKSPSKDANDELIAKKLWDLSIDLVK